MSSRRGKLGGCIFDICIYEVNEYEDKLLLVLVRTSISSVDRGGERELLVREIILKEVTFF